MNTATKFDMDPNILEVCKKYVEIGEFDSTSDIVNYSLR